MPGANTAHGENTLEGRMLHMMDVTNDLGFAYLARGLRLSEVFDINAVPTLVRDPGGADHFP
jgi:hypothetical protein